MASAKPIVRQVAWLALLPQLLFMGLLVFLYWSALKSLYAVFFGLITYLFLSVLLQFTVSKRHRRGIMYYKASKYTEAISEYKRSYDFFSKHPWVDKLRFITLLSASRISYTEMALLNIAYCYAMLEDVAAMKLYYQKAIEEFPNSEMAKQALKMIQAVEDS